MDLFAKKRIELEKLDQKIKILSTSHRGASLQGKRNV